MATIGNYIPSSPSVSEKYIKAPSNYELRMSKYQLQGPFLMEEPTLQMRIRNAIEGHRSKRQLANLLQTAKSIYEVLSNMAMQKGIDIPGILRTFNTRQELAFANNLLAQIGVPIQSVSPDKIKSIITKAGNLESFMSQHSDATLRDAINYALSDDQELQNVLNQSLEDRFTKAIRNGIEDAPEGYNKAGVYKWFKDRLSSGSSDLAYMMPKSSLIIPPGLTHNEYLELVKKVNQLIDNIPAATSPSILNRYFNDVVTRNKNTVYELHIRELLDKTVRNYAAKAG